MENQQKSTETDIESSSLESLETPVSASDNLPDSATVPASPTSENYTAQASTKSGGLKNLLRRFNIYLLFFILLLVLASILSAVSFFKNRQAEETARQQIASQPLSQEALDQLRQTDVKVGDPKQVLSVESNAVFAGKVLVRDNLEVAGEIKAGKALNLPGISISGNSLLGQVQASSLQVGGNTTIQGQLAVQNNLTVSGSGSFGGTLTAARLNIQDLQINGDIKFSRHIDAGGATPSKSDGSALGSGGTSSVSGTDTAGTININTGGNPPAGCFVTINFSQRFNSTPHVVVTPVGSAAANLRYYLNRNNSNFSVCTTTAAGGSQSFGFDYVVID